MVTKIRRERLMIPVAPAIAGAFGCLVSLAVGLAPSALLEQMAVQSGVASVVAVAEPPLGLTARLVMLLLIGGGLGVLMWFALFLLIGPRTLAFAHGGQGRSGEAEGWRPLLRRADAHPDAPARRPVFAQRDLGTPFLDVRAAPEGSATPALADLAEPDDIAMLLPEAVAAADALPQQVLPQQVLPQQVLPQTDIVHRAPAALVARDVPSNLDALLADYDPDAMRPVAAFSPRLAQAREGAALAPGERLEIFELTPMVRPEPATPALSMPTSHPSSISALLERLERGVSQKAERPLMSPAADDSVQQALATLSRVAARR